MAKVLWKISLAFFLILLIWILWPIYGFISNQFEIARLPFGWHALPENAHSDTNLYNPEYEGAGKSALKILEQRRAEISAPSLSAAISIKGELVWAGAVGWRDVKNNIPATPTTAYRIGSTSKAVSATGLARLVNKRVIDLDAPISTYVKKLPNKSWTHFTSRQLASHTAGLAGYEENNDWIGFYQSLALTTHYENPEKSLSVFNNADTLFKPGTGFHYSSFDTVLLSTVMQEAANQPFNSVMNEYVFAPLELKVTQPDHLRNAETEYAISYQANGNRIKPWRRVDLSHKLAAGGYVSTPSELALLGAAWLNPDFIPANIREDFWRPVTLSNGSINEQDYAVGFRRKSWPINGTTVEHLNHGGVSKGAQCWLMIVPDHDISLAISTNRRTDDFFDFADVYVDLLEIFIPAYENLAE